MKNNPVIPHDQVTPGRYTLTQPSPAGGYTLVVTVRRFLGELVTEMPSGWTCSIRTLDPAAEFRPL